MYNFIVPKQIKKAKKKGLRAIRYSFKPFEMLSHDMNSIIKVVIKNEH